VQSGSHAMQALDDVAPKGVWVLKSPHLSFTLPVYRRLLGEVLRTRDRPGDVNAGSTDSQMPGHTPDTPICVLVFRHPAAAARSCVRWNGKPFARSLALWEHYTLSGLHACRVRRIARVSLCYITSTDATPAGAFEASLSALTRLPAIHTRQWRHWSIAWSLWSHA